MGISFAMDVPGNKNWYKIPHCLSPSSVLLSIYAQNGAGFSSIFMKCQQSLGDSRFIVAYLKFAHTDLDKGLADAELAISVAMQRLLEEHLFLATLYSRWQYTDENWQVNKKAILGDCHSSGILLPTAGVKKLNYLRQKPEAYHWGPSKGLSVSR